MAFLSLSHRASVQFITDVEAAAVISLDEDNAEDFSALKNGIFHSELQGAVSVLLASYNRLAQCKYVLLCGVHQHPAISPEFPCEQNIPI